MLTEEQGNLLEAPADALVNTVNTVGIMGRGLALQFKQAYPGNFRAYGAACRRGEVRLGKMSTYETGQPDRPRFVINFPTKGHWRSRSMLSDIEAGLVDLRAIIRQRHIEAIAIPPLGCEIEETIVTPAMRSIESEDPTRHLVGLKRREPRPRKHSRR
jgi:O-acetyl-ADP-ribose deacetylase (regulator of RNase III)